MSKQLASLDHGAVVVSEEAGIFTLAFDESLSVGGGEAADIVSIKGQGQIVLSAAQAEKLAAAFVIAKSPAAAQPIEEAVQEMAEEAIEKL